MAPDTRCIDMMLSGWNTRDVRALEQIVSESLSADVTFCDPLHDIRGHAAFVEMVKAFWAKHADCKITRTSGIDAHHDRARYTWAITRPDGQQFIGFDAVALDIATRKVLRVDGFFGPLSPAT